MEAGRVAPRGTVVLATPAPVTHRTAEENLGIGYLAAVLRAHGEAVVIVDGWLEGLTVAQLADRIRRAGPRLVGFACYRSNMERAIETLALVRAAQADVFAVAGGYGPTFHTNDFLDAGFDAVVRGEGEVPLRMLVDHLRCGTPTLTDIPGLSFRRDGAPHAHNSEPAPKPAMDDLPDPARDTVGLTLRRRSLVHIQTARGCQASCTFCSIVAFERVGGGTTWRQRGLRRVVDEIERLMGLGATHFKVIDDSLVEPPRDAGWCVDLADEIAARGLRPRMRGSIRADRADEDVVAALARAGFFSFSCGIENFAQSALSRMAKRADVDRNKAALDTFRRHGIYVQAGHILFDDATTLAELVENEREMSRYDWTISKGIFTEMYAAAGTNFTRKLRKGGVLEIDRDGLGNSRYPVRDPMVRPVYDTLKRWHKAHSLIYDKTVDPLSAPKALSATELAAFHRLVVRLRRVDLAFFRGLLDLATTARDPDVLASWAELYREAELERSRSWYGDFDAEVDLAYRAADLTYDADANPFLC